MAQAAGIPSEQGDLHMFSSKLIRLVIVLAVGATVLGTACAPAVPPRTTGEPIKIGYVWGVTGTISEIVRPASEATRAYFDDLNKRGGINGRPVQIVEIDSKYQVPLAQEGYKKVTTDDRVALVVLASTGDTEALAQQINADRMPTITFSCDEKMEPGRSRIRTSSLFARRIRIR